MYLFIYLFITDTLKYDSFDQVRWSENSKRAQNAEIEITSKTLASRIKTFTWKKITTRIFCGKV